ncbi:hypothetical protein [Parasitella parasitica]|uniref:Uncharacterized protein n=1 Tax=Parasitella parasitica TaxID=35722 RepID=A0A0B7N967_9FUNG|nr:hypothetical protein [Parasitella parasitica]
MQRVFLGSFSASNGPCMDWNQIKATVLSRWWCRDAEHVPFLALHPERGGAKGLPIFWYSMSVHPARKDRSLIEPVRKITATIIAVRATSMTQGVEGINNTVRLKTIQDAIRIRHLVTENIEKACLPITSPEKRKRLLSFVICGGEPNGLNV